MKIQKVVLPELERITWILIGDDFMPIQPVQDFLDYLRNIGRSPNTVRSYAFHLKLFWEFLVAARLSWDTVKTTDLAEFMT